MVSPRPIGFHNHHFDNLPDVQPGEDAEDGYVFTLLSGAPVWLPPPSGTIPNGGTTGQALAKDSGADGDFDWHDIEDLATAETDDSLVLAPDGAGGVEFRAETGGGGSPDLSLFGPLFGLTPPVDGDYAWINQGGASVNAGTEGIFLLAPAASGTNLRIRKKAAPSTPYTVTAIILPALFGINFTSCGLVFRQSSDGKLIVFNIVHNGEWTLNVEKFNSPTSFSASYVSVARFSGASGGPVFFRIADNGTNRICSWSADGENWYVVHTVGRTDFLTANEVGFYAGSDQTTWPGGLKLISWIEA